MKFKITYGSINPPEEEIISARSLKEANEIAYEAACDDYDSYAGLHGLLDIDQIMEEYGVDEAEAADIFIDERESWLTYDAEEIHENR